MLVLGRFTRITKVHGVHGAHEVDRGIMPHGPFNRAAAWAPCAPDPGQVMAWDELDVLVHQPHTGLLPSRQPLHGSIGGTMGLHRQHA